MFGKSYMVGNFLEKKLLVLIIARIRREDFENERLY